MLSRTQTHGRVIDLELYTDAHRIVGRIAVRTGLISVLNNPDTDYLELLNVEVARITNPKKMIATYQSGSFRKDSVNFVILQNRREGLTRGTAANPSIYTRGKPTNIFMTVPSFEIRGEVMREGYKPSHLLASSPGAFQPIFTASAASLFQPATIFSGDLIMVRKQIVGVFCFDLSVSSTGRLGTKPLPGA